MTQRVWIAQCLCPMRHCILAAANEADDATEAEELITQLREAVQFALSSRMFNPWCSLCKSSAETWRYEVERTPWRTIEEATPTLKQHERRNTLTNALWGDMKRND